MRFIVFGAGAVGGLMGGRLAQNGFDVTLVARGSNYEAIAGHGLTIKSPVETVTVKVAVVNDPAAIAFRDDDIVVLAVKSQDTVQALESLQATAPLSVSIVCAQNGVENERMAIRRFPNVYGMFVLTSSSYLEPGIVEPRRALMTGIMDIGRYPSGSDPLAVEIAGALEQSTYSSFALDDIMRWKYGKLLRNLGTVVEAVCGSSSRGDSVIGELARAEGRAVLDAAGIAAASDEEEKERRAFLPADVSTPPRSKDDGGSSWQSLRRGLGSIEADYLSGEIVLLGRQVGVPVPVNAALQYFANKMARERTAPGTVPEQVVLDLASHRDPKSVTVAV